MKGLFKTFIAEMPEFRQRLAVLALRSGSAKRVYAVSLFLIRMQGACGTRVEQMCTRI